MCFAARAARLKSFPISAGAGYIARSHRSRRSGNPRRRVASRRAVTRERESKTCCEWFSTREARIASVARGGGSVYSIPEEARIESRVREGGYVIRRTDEGRQDIGKDQKVARARREIAREDISRRDFVDVAYRNDAPTRAASNAAETKDRFDESRSF